MTEERRYKRGATEEKLEREDTEERTQKRGHRKEDKEEDTEERTHRRGHKVRREDRETEEEEIQFAVVQTFFVVFLYNSSRSKFVPLAAAS